MKLKFKVQPYQTVAVESVVDCFAGQPNTSGVTYRGVRLPKISLVMLVGI